MQFPENFPRVVLEELRRHQGTLWKEVYGELQIQFEEIAIWILLYHDSELLACHDQFCQIVSNYFDVVAPINFTVHYIILSEGVEYSLAFLVDNAEILRRVGDETLGAMPDQRPIPPESVFKAENSDREY